MSETETQGDPIRISEGRDGDRSFVIHPQDDDLFVRSGKQVIESCRLGISIELWLTELRSMLEFVHEWTAKRASKVHSCYCAPRGSQNVLFFVPSAGRFDFDLADELALLNIELLRRFNVGMIEIHQIPESELDRFIDPAEARRVYGELREPHSAVET